MAGEVTNPYKDPNRLDKHAGIRMEDVCTPEEIELGRYLLPIYNGLANDRDYREENLKWKMIDEACELIRQEDPDPDYPNSMIPTLVPDIEGQVSHLGNLDMSFRFKPYDPGHTAFMKPIDVGWDYARRVGRFAANFKDYAREYVKYGVSWLMCEVIENRTSSKVLPKQVCVMRNVHVRHVLIDGRVQNSINVQDAEYIMVERGKYPLSYAKMVFGEDKANALLAGVGVIDAKETTEDDFKGFDLLIVWLRDMNDNGHLKQIYMDTNGLVLKVIQPEKTFMKYVGSELPFHLARGICLPDQLYGYGDGLMLYPIQTTINKLTDDIELAARYAALPMMFIDPRSKVNFKKIGTNPFKPIPCLNPNQFVRMVQGPGINQITFTFLQYLKEKSEDMTLFRGIMTGQQQAASTTATATNYQVMQGSVGMNNKKADLVEGVKWASTFCMKVNMALWEDTSFWHTVDDDTPTMIDMKGLSQRKASVPLTPKTFNAINKRMKDNHRKPRPEDYPVYETDSNADVTLGFESEVKIGDQLPEGKHDRFNRIVTEGQMAHVGPDGKPVYVMTMEALRQNLEDVTGIPVMTAKEKQKAKMQLIDEAVMATAQRLSPQLGGPPINPVAQGGGVASAQGSSISPLPTALAGTAPGASNTDRRGIMGG